MIKETNDIEILRVIFSSHADGVHTNRVRNLCNYFLIDLDTIDQYIEYMEKVGEIGSINGKYFPTSTRVIEFQNIDLIISAKPTEFIKNEFPLINLSIDECKGWGRVCEKMHPYVISQDYYDWIKIPKEQKKWFQDKVEFYESNLTRGEINTDTLKFYCPWKGQANYYRYSQLSKLDKKKAILFKDSYGNFGWLKFKDETSLIFSMDEKDIVRFMLRINAKESPEKNSYYLQKFDRGFLLKHDFIPEQEQVLFQSFGAKKIESDVNDPNEKELHTYSFEEKFSDIIKSTLNALLK
jgi:hypothetical protein